MSDPTLIIYDGECIYCQSYVRFMRLRDAVGPVELVDARSDDPRVADYWRRYDLNEGMLVVYRGQVYHGAQAVHMLAGLSSESSAFNKLNARLFSNRTAAKVLYPMLKLGRRLTLVALGRRLIQRPDATPASPPAPSPTAREKV